MKNNMRWNKTKEALPLYLTEISRTPLLTSKEEKSLGRRIQKGDEEALEILVKSNLRFVVTVAKRYRGFGVSFLDLINEGNLGLIEAARRFDPKKKVRFISYAVWWIRQSMMNALSSLSRPVRLPTKINAVLYKVAARFRDADEKPTLEELSVHVGIRPSELLVIMEAGGEAVSLSQQIAPGKEGMLEDFLVQSIIPSAEQEIAGKLMKENLEQALLDLGNREQEVLKLRYGLGEEDSFTLQQIADRIGLSRERVRQIEEKALQKLRKSPRASSLLTAYSGTSNFGHLTPI